MSNSEDDDSEPMPKMRRFQQDPENELLPLKVGKKIIRVFKKPYIKEDIKEEVSEEEKETPKPTAAEEPKLSVQELLLKQERVLNEVKQRITELSNSIINFPQENFCRLKELREICAGTASGVDVLAREQAQKWALASLTEVYIGIVPGYAIRELSEAESSQKMKTETKKIMEFEAALLRNYQKFLQILEKNAMKLTKSKVDEHTFSAKVGYLSTKCLCRLLGKMSHFNFVVNIINCLVQLTRSSNAKLVGLVCSTFSACLSEDFRLEVSVHIAKVIANFVNARKGRCTPQLLRVFIALRIRDVEKICKAEREEEEIKRKASMHAKHLSRTAKKEKKKKRKVEDPLREAEVAEKFSTKFKLATETMKFVFTTYFRVLKRLPTTALMEPVLEGLAKFAHLINVEFFNDLITALSNLLRQNQLKLCDSLRCVKTVCAILTNDGQVLNIDPLFFYNALFGLLPGLVFQPESMLNLEVELLINCVDVLLVKRRRVVPLKRVAAFVKRLVALAVLVPNNNAVLALLSIIRTIFISHPNLAGVLLGSNDADDEDCVMSGIFQPDSADPDTSNSLSTSINSELEFISKHTNNEIVRAFSANILHHITSTGEYRLNAQWATRPPIDWLNDISDRKLPAEKSNEQMQIVSQMTEKERNPLRSRFDTFCKKKIVITPANVCSTLCMFLNKQNT